MNVFLFSYISLHMGIYWYRGCVYVVLEVCFYSCVVPESVKFLYAACWFSLFFLLISGMFWARKMYESAPKSLVTFSFLSLMTDKVRNGILFQRFHSGLKLPLRMMEGVTNEKIINAINKSFRSL